MGLEGTYIEPAGTSNGRVNNIIDTLLNARIERFRQLKVQREQVTPGDNPRQSTWRPWLPTAPIDAVYNGLHAGEYPSAGTLTLTNQVTGEFEYSPELEDGDTLYISYYFDYFPTPVLEAFIDQSVDLINAGEPATSYTINNAPAIWDGAIVEQVYQLCLEKLILDDLLWVPRLIFADPESVVSQLESALSASKDRLQNQILPGLKKAPYVSSPTQVYWDAILMGGGQSGFHGGRIGYGKTRGMHINRWFGR